VDSSRRKFVVGSAVVLGTYAVCGCSGSSSGDNLAATPAPVSGRSYSTDFDLTEFPISEGGAWSNTGQPWTKVRTAEGLAFGSNGQADTYDDSYAYLSGFPPNQQGEAVVHVDANLAGAPHEVELLLRWTDSTQSARGYECLFNFQGGVQIMRWNGPFGDFTELPASGSGGLGRGLVTGDVIKATIVGTIITTYINGRRISQASDGRWPDGQPGIGFFKRRAGLNSDFALTSYKASAL
jgi:hypothetical protein